VGWLVTGAWMLRTWYVRREDKPRINVIANLRKIYSNEQQQIVEIEAQIANSGDVRHIFRDMTYSLRGSDLSNIKSSEKALGQVELDYERADCVRFFPETWGYSFVDAGQTSTYRTIVELPASIKLLKLTVNMKYGEHESDFHSAAWFGYVGAP
jgi:hypothetical protein